MRSLLLLFTLLLSQSAWAAGPVDIRFYLERFGGQVKTPEALAAQAVFERVRAVADRRQAYWPELVVLRHQPNGPALAIPDGHVLLGEKALKSLYQGVSKSLGDTRLAFVLGHELAHFADDDFWHAQASRSLTEWADKAAPKARLAQPDAKARQALELRADDLGFLYAAMAGYPVAELFSNSGKGDFFDGWLASQSAARQSSHPALAKRARLLKARLRSRSQHLALFDFGVQLARLGRCEDALPLLNRFQREFPNREVLNNQAFCHLQLALEKMPTAEASQVWWPLLLDSASVLGGGNTVVLRSPKLSAAVKRHLQIAVELLDRAAKQDDRYWPAQINLAIAQSLLGSPYAARAAVEAAFQQQPNNILVAGTRALLIAKQPDTREQGMRLLERLLNRVAANEELPWRYNLAQLKGGDDSLSGEWAALAQQSQRLPNAIRAVVCSKQQCAAPKAAKKNRNTIQAAALGKDVLASSYKGPQADFTMALAGVDVAVYSNGSNERWLALDGVVELVQKRVDLSPAQLVKQYGQTVQLPMANGQLHRYRDWSALEQDGRIVQLWLMTQP